MQNSSQNVTINKPTPNFFYRLDALPVANQQCQSTDGKSVKLSLESQNFQDVMCQKLEISLLFGERTEYEPQHLASGSVRFSTGYGSVRFGLGSRTFLLSGFVRFLAKPGFWFGSFLLGLGTFSSPMKMSYLVLQSIASK